MGYATNLPGDLNVPGTLRISGGISPTLARSSVLAIAENEPFVIPWTWWRVWDALHTNLPGTAATDDLALIGGTFASATPSIRSVDFGGTSTTAYARVQIPLPWEYEDGQTVTLRFHAGMLSTVSNDYARLDMVCYESDEELGISADICATGLQSVNSLTLADIDFVITPTALAAGSLLDVRIVVTGNDTGDAGDGITVVIGSVKLLCDVR